MSWPDFGILLLLLGAVLATVVGVLFAIVTAVVLVDQTLIRRR